MLFLCHWASIHQAIVDFTDNLTKTKLTGYRLELTQIRQQDVEHLTKRMRPRKAGTPQSVS